MSAHTSQASAHPSPFGSTLSNEFNDADVRESLTAALCPPKGSSTRTAIERSLSHLLTDAASRGEIWQHIDSCGVPPMTTAEGLRLLAQFLEKCPPPDESLWACACAALLEHAIKINDRDLISALGETTLRRPLDTHSIVEFSIPFLDCETHNYKQLPHLEPWVTLLSSGGDGQCAKLFLDAIRERIERGERSTSDFLVSVVCMSPDAGSVAEMDRFIAWCIPSAQKASTLDRSLLDRLSSIVIFVAEVAVQSTVLLPFTLAISYLAGNKDAVLPFQPLGVAVVFSTTLSILRRLESDQPGFVVHPGPSTPVSALAKRDILEMMYEKLAPFEEYRAEIRDTVARLRAIIASDSASGV